MVAHDAAVAQERRDVIFVGYLGPSLRRAPERGASQAGSAEEESRASDWAGHRNVTRALIA